MFRDSSPPWLSVSVGFQSLGQCCMLCSRFSLKSYKVLWQAGLPLSFVCCFIHSILSLYIYTYTLHIYIYVDIYLIGITHGVSFTLVQAGHARSLIPPSTSPVFRRLGACDQQLRASAKAVPGGSEVSWVDPLLWGGPWCFWFTRPGKHTKSYWTWPIEIVSFPIKNSDFPQLC